MTKNIHNSVYVLRTHVKQKSSEQKSRYKFCQLVFTLSQD